uniref:Oleoyl-acyl carrier protein thioesterase n=1 Tax=Tanacetum cinerariifolium TaxID=118510 RepID=A0A6L2NTD5_TANCI|nr:oleoyl-acyl carrier protein thioesterase [Tanacetum cinerariifolium]
MVSQPPLVSMPMTSSNLYVNGITFATANFRPTSYYGRKTVVSCSSLPRRVSTSNTMTSGDQASGLNALRLGDLSEDGLFYKEKFVIRFSEVGVNGAATIETIATLLQILRYMMMMMHIEFNTMWYENEDGAGRIHSGGVFHS